MTTILVLVMLALASPSGGKTKNRAPAPAEGELVLAGVNVVSTAPHALTGLLGNPTSTTGSPCLPGQEAFSSFFSTWEIGGETLEIAGVCGADLPNHGRILFIQLKGSGAGASGLSTGKGLRLGQQRTDIARIYGDDLRAAPREKGPGTMIQLESRGDCPTLTILLNSEQRVTEIELLGCG